MDSQANHPARKTDRDSHAGRIASPQVFGGDRPTKVGQTADRISNRPLTDEDRGPVIFPNNGAYQVHAQPGGVMATAHNSTDGMTDPHHKQVFKNYVGMGVANGPKSTWTKQGIGYYQHVTEHIPSKRPENWPADVEGHPDWDK
jgi:hypothetical protein